MTQTPGKTAFYAVKLAFIRRALRLTIRDAEKNGFVYGKQSNAMKAIKLIDDLIRAA